MRKKSYLIVMSLVLVFTMFLTSCSNTNTRDTTKEGSTKEVKKTEEKVSSKITVAAAASLTDAFNEMQPIFKEKENIELEFTYGASGTLQKQIEEGAGIDLFISASTKNMDELVEKDLIDKDTVDTIVKNALVLITPKDSEVKSIADLEALNDKIAIGETESVPAGQYAKQSLESLDLWNKLEDKYVFAKDVRAVLSYVSTGEAGAGFVYKSDTIGEDNVVIVETIEESNHDLIIYPGGVISESKERDAAMKFLDYLKTDEAKEILTKYGFVVD
ncbi:molybdate ABC transporter substrate-binding protein [Miniphocaeibacter halophilus]|uniref:Molybdate ABC transporter substrate-binding protein n=1 Tax=Miniphocaeibacter halophilus TaxID=2931922 RepID=A0AC61MU89_9FIRM|nr:molybdate ABC transporter substrate-binding protein [Miniphocaeibacter halophilus]QQK07773.1 molybdate ABC transporter substrate-binding protein [Miniphocaeibacter halophilus]